MNITCTSLPVLLQQQKFEQVIGKPIVAFNVEEDGSSINLCQAHYNYLYSQLTLSTACESCGGKPRKGEQFNRHCPEPNSINTYPTMVSGDPCHLTTKSLVCTACYKHFKVILGNLQKAKTLNVTYRPTVGYFRDFTCFLRTTSRFSADTRDLAP